MFPDSYVLCICIYEHYMYVLHIAVSGYATQVLLCTITIQLNITHLFTHSWIMLHSHIHEYGHVQNGWNGHRMFINDRTSGDSSLFLLLVPPAPPSVNFSSQPVVRGPKVSHYSCYCVILHCIAQIDKRTLHGVYFCKQSRYYIICSLVNTVDKIIFFLSKV